MFLMAGISSATKINLNGGNNVEKEKSGPLPTKCFYVTVKDVNGDPVPNTPVFFKNLDTGFHYYHNTNKNGVVDNTYKKFPCSATIEIKSKYGLFNIDKEIHGDDANEQYETGLILINLQFNIDIDTKSVIRYGYLKQLFFNNPIFEKIF